MPKAAIISKPQKPELNEILRDLVPWLETHGFEAFLDSESASYFGPDGPSTPRCDMPLHNPDIVIVLGGDGTLLSASRAFANSSTPIISVNLGSLGFLTETPLADLHETLEAFFSGHAHIDKRAMMCVRLVRDGQTIRQWETLNDAVVSKSTIARMADFSIEIDGQRVAAFRADGVLVSTPTGSTAYNLAANGPIMMATVDALIVNPICPHLLTLRPIVVPGDSNVSIHIEGVPNQTMLTADGQEAVDLNLGDTVHCCRSQYSVHLIRLRQNGLFNVLRSKLSWGER